MDDISAESVRGEKEDMASSQAQAEITERRLRPLYGEQEAAALPHTLCLSHTRLPDEQQLT